MPDQAPTPPPKPPTSQPAPVPVSPASQKGPTINIGEEYGTAKKNLPPAKIVLIAIAGVAVIVAIASFLQRPKPQGAGSLDNVTAAEIPGQNSTITTLTFTLRNTTDKILYVRSIRGEVKTSSGEFEAEAVSAVDFDRYFQIFPVLKEGSKPALSPETKLQPDESIAGSAIVAFPVTLDAFNHRQSISVEIQPYDQPVPVVLSK
jgi:hypothetical protein